MTTPSPLPDRRRPLSARLTIEPRPWLRRALSATVLAAKAVTLACAVDAFVNTDSARLRGKAMRTRVVARAALLLAEPTAGLSLAVVAGINVYLVHEHAKEYVIQEALTGSSLTRATLGEVIGALKPAIVSLLTAGVTASAAKTSPEEMAQAAHGNPPASE